MQKRQYKKQKKQSGILFAAFCIFFVLLVTAAVALLARQRPPAPKVTEELTFPSESVEVFFTCDVTEAVETSTLPEETASETSVSTEETTVATPRTFVPVSENEGTRRIENFIFYEPGSPEYRLAELLFLKVPPVVKTAEVTETVSTEETLSPEETTVAVTEEPAETDSEESAVETTVETYTYEVEGVAALYYKDLYDGEVIVFAPNETIFGASMIKAAYAFALLQLAERDEIDLDEELIYTEEMFTEGSGDFEKIEYDTPFTVKELIRRMVNRSDNTALTMLQTRFGTAFFSDIMKEFSLTPTRFGAWWRTTVTNYGEFFTVLAGYLLGENRYGKWLCDQMCDSLQSVMLKQALRPETVAHKYGWDTDSYCDGAVVLNENPYVLVFMSNLDEGHLKAENTRFIKEIGGIIKRLHDEKHEAIRAAEATATATEEVSAEPTCEVTTTEAATEKATAACEVTTTEAATEKATADGEVTE